MFWKWMHHCELLGKHLVTCHNLSSSVASPIISRCLLCSSSIHSYNLYFTTSDGALWGPHNIWVFRMAMLSSCICNSFICIIRCLCISRLFFRLLDLVMATHLLGHWTLFFHAWNKENICSCWSIEDGQRRHSLRLAMLSYIREAELLTKYYIGVIHFNNNNNNKNWHL